MMKNGGVAILLRGVTASFSPSSAMAATAMARIMVSPPPFSGAAVSTIFSTSSGTRCSCSLTHFRPHLPPACHTILEILFLRDWDASLEADLAYSDVALTPDLVEQIMNCIPSPKLALQFFIWSGERIGYPPPSSPASYEIAQWYCHKSKVHIFLSILATLNRPHLNMSPAKVNVLIQGYGWAGMVDRAYKALKKNQGFSNVMLVNCLLHSIIKESRFDMAHKVYMEMRRCGTPLVVSCNILIYGMSLGGKLQEANVLLEQMVSIGCSPDVTAYNTLISKLCEAGQLDRACKLLQDMIDGNLAPDNVTFNAVVVGLSRAKHWDRARKVANDMQERGCTIYPSTYRAMLCGPCDDGKMEKAFHQLEIRSTHGLSPDASTSGVLVRAFGNIDKIEED